MVLVVALDEVVCIMLPRDICTLAVLGRDWPSRAVSEYTLDLL